MFKVGDKVRVIRWFNREGQRDTRHDGQILTLMGGNENLWSTGVIGLDKNDIFELVNPLGSNIMSNIVEKVRLALKTEPEKSLIKAGILDEKEALTSEGKEVLEMILVDKFKPELKEKADIILAEEKK